MVSIRGSSWAVLPRAIVRLAGLLFLAASNPAIASNLIPGSGFDAPGELTMHWSNLGADKVWSSDDRLGSGQSGSLLMINDEDPLTGILVFSSCVPVVPGEIYSFGAWHFVQFLQPAEGYAQVEVQWRESCPAGAFLPPVPTASSSAIGSWTLIEDQAEAPTGANGARLVLVDTKTAGAAGLDLAIYFDDAFLPEPSGVALGVTALLVLWVLRASRDTRARPLRVGSSSY
jgi:hypothetical protein